MRSPAEPWPPKDRKSQAEGRDRDEPGENSQGRGEGQPGGAQRRREVETPGRPLRRRPESNENQKKRGANRPSVDPRGGLGRSLGKAVEGRRTRHGVSTRRGTPAIPETRNVARVAAGWKPSRRPIRIRLGAYLSVSALDPGRGCAPVRDRRAARREPSAVRRPLLELPRARGSPGPPGPFGPLR